MRAENKRLVLVNSPSDEEEGAWQEEASQSVVIQSFSKNRSSTTTTGPSPCRRWNGLSGSRLEMYLFGLLWVNRRRRRQNCHCSWIHNNNELRCAETISLSDSHPDGWQEDRHPSEVEHIIMRIVKYTQKEGKRIQSDYHSAKNFEIPIEGKEEVVR